MRAERPLRLLGAAWERPSPPAPRTRVAAAVAHAAGASPCRWSRGEIPLAFSFRVEWVRRFPISPFFGKGVRHRCLAFQKSESLVRNILVLAHIKTNPTNLSPFHASSQQTAPSVHLRSINSQFINCPEVWVSHPQFVRQLAPFCLKGDVPAFGPFTTK